MQFVLHSTTAPDPSGKLTPPVRRGELQQAGACLDPGPQESEFSLVKRRRILNLARIRVDPGLRTQAPIPQPLDLLFDRHSLSHFAASTAQLLSPLGIKKLGGGKGRELTLERVAF